VQTTRYRAIEFSDPAFESTNLRQITVKSQSLRGRGDITVFVPSLPEDTEPIPSGLLRAALLRPRCLRGRSVRRDHLFTYSARSEVRIPSNSERSELGARTKRNPNTGYSR
jgi:hypothetical protein